MPQELIHRTSPLGGASLEEFVAVFLGRWMMAKLAETRPGSREGLSFSFLSSQEKESFRFLAAQENKNRFPYFFHFLPPSSTKQTKGMAAASSGYVSSSFCFVSFVFQLLVVLMLGFTCIVCFFFVVLVLVFFVHLGSGFGFILLATFSRVTASPFI